jgi:hypothetical protein
MIYIGQHTGLLSESWDVKSIACLAPPQWQAPSITTGRISSWSGKYSKENNTLDLSEAAKRKQFPAEVRRTFSLWVSASADIVISRNEEFQVACWKVHPTVNTQSLRLMAYIKSLSMHHPKGFPPHIKPTIRPSISILTGQTG